MSYEAQQGFFFVPFSKCHSMYRATGTIHLFGTIILYVESSIFQIRTCIYIREIQIKMKKEICGYAIRFNNWYWTFNPNTNESYCERILPEACTQEFVNSQIVVCRLQHKNDYKLASNFKGDEVRIERDSQGNENILTEIYFGDGNLKLKVDNIGLFYSFEVDETNPAHRATVRMINKGVLKGSSYYGEVCKKDFKIEKIKGINYCTILKINELRDVSPCTKGANPQTTVELRYVSDDKEVQEYLKERQFKKYYDQLQKEYLPSLY
jgi:phage head maturation protease